MCVLEKEMKFNIIMFVMSPDLCCLLCGLGQTTRMTYNRCLEGQSQLKRQELDFGHMSPHIFMKIPEGREKNRQWPTSLSGCTAGPAGCRGREDKPAVALARTWLALFLFKGPALCLMKGKQEVLESGNRVLTASFLIGGLGRFHKILFSFFERRKHYLTLSIKICDLNSFFTLMTEWFSKENFLKKSQWLPTTEAALFNGGWGVGERGVQTHGMSLALLPALFSTIALQ